jgi:hypothetical protein
VGETPWRFESSQPHPRRKGVHSGATVAEALRLRDEDGLGARSVARRLGIPLPTVRDWHAGKLPRNYHLAVKGIICPGSGQNEHRVDELGPAYVHLLGLYLGDGSISTHPRGVFRLRVFLDKKYPQIVEECVQSMQTTVPDNRVHVLLLHPIAIRSRPTRELGRACSPSMARGRSTPGRYSSPSGSRSLPNAGRSNYSRG